MEPLPSVAARKEASHRAASSFRAATEGSGLSKPMQKPIRLEPSLREKVWGKTHLAPWFPDSAERIGEAWYLADRELPLLVKLIFTSERLSVQVHPDDGEDGPRGKTEMWHILAADPGATIALGFRQPITRQRLREATLSGEIEQLVNWLPVKAGETYFTPAHTVHAIGAGIVLCEIQQNSDVTYRLWDYGRPRPIHVDQAVPISRPHRAPRRVPAHRYRQGPRHAGMVETFRYRNGADRARRGIHAVGGNVPALDLHRGRRHDRRRDGTRGRSMAAAGDGRAARGYWNAWRGWRKLLANLRAGIVPAASREACG